jgi:hypothetical protein
MSYQPSIYSNDTENSCRFALGTQGINPLIVIGINPSTADEKLPDRTIRKVIGFANRNGYDSFIMLNLYPQRTPYPDDLHMEINEDIFNCNLKTIYEVVTKYDNPTILVAWSERITVRRYLKNCLKYIFDVIEKSNVTWLKIGELTKRGHPRHPLYASYNLAFTNFDISEYTTKQLYNNQIQT